MADVNESRVKRTIFDAACAFKKKEMKGFVIRNNSYFDQLVFKKIREGNRLFLNTRIIEYL